MSVNARRLANAASRLARYLSRSGNAAIATSTGVPKGGYYTLTQDGKKPETILGLLVENAGLPLRGPKNEMYQETMARLVGVDGPDSVGAIEHARVLISAARYTKNPRRDLPQRLLNFATFLRRGNFRKPYVRTVTKAVGFVAGKTVVAAKGTVFTPTASGFLVSTPSAGTGVNVSPAAN